MNKHLLKAFSLITILALMLAAMPIQSTQAAATDLFFSEYIEGSSFNKAVEIYNSTGAAVNLSTYSVQLYSNGSPTPSQSATLSGTLADGDVFVLAHGSANAAILAVADATNNLVINFNGDDAVVLRNSGVVVDVIGQVGFDPGTEWGTGLVSTADNTIRRKADTCAGDTNETDAYDPAAEWDGFANDTFNGLGAHTSNCSITDLAPTVLSVSPSNGDSGVAVSSNITINFSEAVDVVAGAITVECPVSNVVASNTAVDNLSTVVIDPAIDLPFSTSCAIKVAATGVTDEDAIDPPNNLDADFNSSFTTMDSTPPAGAVVISEVYGGGGNSGATYTNDYIELYNRTANTISLAGWSVQYASAAGTSWAVTNLNGSIGPGKYYLVQEAAGSGGTTALPAPEATGTIAMGGTAGKVALVQNSTPLTGSCPTGTHISDFVGYGTTANCYEGSGPTPAPSNTNSVSRLGNGATDTDNNAADFVAGAPDPDNGTDPAPTVASTTPANGAANVALISDISITFSEPVNVSGSWFNISCSTSGAHTASVSGGPTTFTLNPDTDFVNTETCTVTVVAAQVSDQDADDPFDTMAADYVFSFSTEGPVCTQAYTPAYTIQGSGASAAITGTVTTQGVVVGDFEGSAAASGFYLQDATGDGDTATSDGIFVFTGSANTVSVGDVVRVTGYARERFNQTALNGSNNNTAAVPASNIINCGTGSVAATDVSMPFASATFLEQYEGMLVRFPQSLVIAEYFNYDRFGEVVLALPLDGEPRPFSGTAVDMPGAPANARILANSLRRITLDDIQSAQNPVVLRHPNGSPFTLENRFRGGDTVQNAIGVLGYDFNLYRILPTAGADYTAVNQRPASPDPVGGTVRVAAMNTLNFFVTLDALDDDSADNPADNVCGGNANLDCRGADLSQPTEFSRQRDKLLVALSGLNADVIGLNELENTPGAEPLESIVSGLPGYDFIDTGTIGTDAIKVGIIYRPAVVTPLDQYQILDSTDDPRFIDTRSRPALAQTFKVNETGAVFTVVVNHFKSKGSACSGDPDAGDGQGNCNGTRTLAAQALVDWLANDPTGSGDPDFLIMGDLNSYAMEDPITAIKAGADDTAGTGDDYVNLIYNFHGPYAYSYTFDGQAGYLDHALANTSLFSQITGATEWHINSDEPDVLDYDTSFKPAAQEALYEVNQYRTSDHDAVIVGLNLLNAAPNAANDNYSTAEDTALTVAAPGVLSNDSDAEDQPLTASLVGQPSNGSVTLNSDGSFTYTPNSNFNGSDSFTYKANDGYTDSNEATVSITVNAVNDAPVCTTPQSGSTNEDTALNGSLGCSDVDSSLNYSKVSDPSHGTVTVNSDGTFTYTPSANYNGSDSFTFKSSDGSLDSNIATFNITIAAVNDNPDAADDTATVHKNSSVVVLIYLNDSDVDGDTLNVISFTQPSHGTVSYSAKNRNFRYTPPRGFTGTVTFTYTISDGHGGTDTATVTITVHN